MLSINRQCFFVLMVGAFLVTGCQTLDNELAEKDKLPLEPVIELTPMEKLHQSPNNYLLSTPDITPDVVQRFKLALLSVNNKEWDRAKEQLLAVTIAAPTLSGPWLQLGDIAVEELAKEHAIAHYQQAIYVNELNYFAHNRLATLLREKGEFEQAKAHYEKALTAWPAFVTARQNLAILLDIYMGQQSAALKEYETVAALSALNGQSESRQLKGWIADLSRRVAAQEKREQRLAAPLKTSMEYSSKDDIGREQGERHE